MSSGRGYRSTLHSELGTLVGGGCCSHSSLNVVSVDSGEVQVPGASQSSSSAESSAGAVLESCLLLGTEKFLIYVCVISH